MKVCEHYSVYVTHNSCGSSRVLKKKTSILVAILFFVTRDLNVRIEVGKTKLDSAYSNDVKMYIYQLFPKNAYHFTFH